MKEKSAVELAEWLAGYFGQQLSQSGDRPEVIPVNQGDNFYAAVRITRTAAMQKALVLVAGSMGEVQKASIPYDSHGLTLIKTSEQVFVLSDVVFPETFWREESIQFVGMDDITRNFPGCDMHLSDERYCLVAKGGYNCNLLLIGGLSGLTLAQELLKKLVNIESVRSITLVDLSSKPGHPDYISGKYMVLIAGWPWSSD